MKLSDLSENLYQREQATGDATVVAVVFDSITQELFILSMTREEALTTIQMLKNAYNLR